MEDGSVRKVKIDGNGRFSVGRPTGRADVEVRIYKNASDKYYVATVSGVKNVWRDDVDMSVTLPPGATASKSTSPWSYTTLPSLSRTKRTPSRRMTKADLEELSAAVVSGVLGKGDPEEDDELVKALGTPIEDD